MENIDLDNLPHVGPDPACAAFEKLYERIEKKPLGEGTYGEVYKARCTRSGLICAMKRMKLDHEDEGVPSTAIREVSVLKGLNHPNVVRLLDVFCSIKKLYLIFEFVEGDLRKYMKAKGALTPAQAKSFSFQLLLGVDYMHSNRIMHRDLKPQNLLLGSDGVLKIADFGLARAFRIPVPKYTHEVVTVWYRSPEILLGSQYYALPVDVWSAGCIIAEMANSHALFAGDCEIDTIFKIFKRLGTPNKQMWPAVEELPDFKKTFPNWPPRSFMEPGPMASTLGEQGADLVSKLLVYPPGKRMCCRTALEHRYFDDLDKMCYLLPRADQF